jgi:cytochrome c oxidase subunit IV
MLVVCAWHFVSTACYKEWNRLAEISVIFLPTAFLLVLVEMKYIALYFLHKAAPVS